MKAPVQLVATLGPASWPLAPALAAAGATAFRLNASHLDLPHLERVLADIRGDLPETDILVDLQGAKMRLGHLTPCDVARGQRMRFALEAADGIPLPHPEFFKEARPGDTISVDDGRVRFRVETSGDGCLDATALAPGRLQARKGVNVVEHPVTLEGLTPADRDAVTLARAFGVSAFAISFMTDGREAGWVKALAPSCRVIGKVERREATESLERIARHVETVWICRGDLGAQLGTAALPRFVASIDPRTLPVPVLMAGQVLEHLTRHAEPTRSEVCHLFDLIARGYAGLVLSDETAIGDDPVRAVSAAATLLANG